jgi:DNA-binding winged helix-turn-helix (wHTH) protein/tetratricopeptide (TPR) repeat protein
MKSFQPFSLDDLNQCLWRGDTRVMLQPKPFAVLRYLVEHAGQLVTHDDLLTAIWPDTYVQPEVLRRYILEIRRVLGDDAAEPRFIETLPKRGYQFIATVTDVDVSLADSTATIKLVGRESALADLDSYFQKSLRGERQIVFITGEAGIGKTSLADAFQHNVARLSNVWRARGQCVEGFGGKEAYYPIFEALGQLTRGSDKAFLNILAKQAPTWLIQFPSLTSVDQRAALEQDVIGATRERMVRELCEALETLTTKFTLALVLEDLHLADHSTLDLISAIARRRQPAKLFVLATLRPAQLIVLKSPLKQLKQDLMLHHLSHEIPLERLRESDVADYLAGEFGECDLPLGFSGVIHQHSDGNPLFMTAILEHLEQNAVLSRVDGRWRMTRPLEKVEPGVPETLRQMLEVQLQQLSGEEQQLLKCASVAGEHFTAWSVATMMESDVASAEERVSGLADRQHCVKWLGTRELANGVRSSEYEFRHALYREVLYRALNPTQLVNFHRRLAHGLEKLRSAAETEAAAEIAMHFEEGQEYYRAILYLMLAAENATRRWAHHEAIAALERACELLLKLEKEHRPDLEVRLLERIGDAQYALGDMERSAATYHMMATRAAEANMLTDQANALMRLAHSAEAIPFFLRAVELDPNFASAYVSLSRIYSNLGETERAKEYARLAYEQREDVSEQERLSITYQYHFEVTGNQSEACRILEIWKQSSPAEFQPANSLSFMHNVLGDFEAAVEEGLEAVGRNPAHGFPYSNLAHAYRGLGRFAEARQTAEEAVKKNIETLPTRRLLYELAILAGENDVAARHVEWAHDKPREFEFVGALAQVAAYSGRVIEARQLYEKTARMAEQRNLADVGTNHLAWSTYMELVYGNTERANNQARRVLARKPSYDPDLRVALTLAMTGSADDAEAMTDKLTIENPEHTIINSVLAPIARAGIELARQQPRRALEQLAIVAPFEMGFVAALVPLYLRATAYMKLSQIEKAIDEFQRVLAHRGSDPFSPFHPAALVGLAQAQALAGDTLASKQSYERFLADWNEADPDVPLLLAARAEYDRIENSSADAALYLKSR